MDNEIQSAVGKLERLSEELPLGRKIEAYRTAQEFYMFGIKFGALMACGRSTKESEELLKYLDTKINEVSPSLGRWSKGTLNHDNGTNSGYLTKK